MSTTVPGYGHLKRKLQVHFLRADALIPPSSNQGDTGSVEAALFMWLSSRSTAVGSNMHLGNLVVLGMR